MTFSSENHFPACSLFDGEPTVNQPSTALCHVKAIQLPSFSPPSKRSFGVSQKKGHNSLIRNRKMVWLFTQLRIWFFQERLTARFSSIKSHSGSADVVRSHPSNDPSTLSQQISEIVFEVFWLRLCWIRALRCTFYPSSIQ